MLDFDIDLDFALEPTQLSICGLVKKAKSKDRITLTITSETKQLAFLLPEIKQGTVYKFLSVKGGFASINFIDLIAKREVIKDLFVSSLAVGQKQILHLDKLKEQGKIHNARFLLGGLFKQRGLDVKYNYFNVFDDVCKKNGWRYETLRNHSKIILMRTAKNFYVIETSSNLNSNPAIEQFSLENDKDLYDWYNNFFSEFFGD